MTEKYRWTGNSDQLVNYPYVESEEDIAAFNSYASRGFLPPQRPNGFLDDRERMTWGRWLEKCKN